MASSSSSNSNSLKIELKTWERNFIKTNNRKPDKSDIKANPDIAAKYKEYNKTRSNSVPPLSKAKKPTETPSTPKSSKRQINVNIARDDNDDDHDGNDNDNKKNGEKVDEMVKALIGSPSRRTKSINTSPSKKQQQPLFSSPHSSPSKEQNPLLSTPRRTKTGNGDSIFATSITRNMTPKSSSNRDSNNSSPSISSSPNKTRNEMANFSYSGNSKRPFPGSPSRVIIMANSPSKKSKNQQTTTTMTTPKKSFKNSNNGHDDNANPFLMEDTPRSKAKKWMRGDTIDSNYSNNIDSQDAQVKTSNFYGNSNSNSTALSSSWLKRSGNGYKRTNSGEITNNSDGDATVPNGLVGAIAGGGGTQAQGQAQDQEQEQEQDQDSVQEVGPSPIKKRRKEFIPLFDSDSPQKSKSLLSTDSINLNQSQNEIFGHHQDSNSNNSNVHRPNIFNKTFSSTFNNNSTDKAQSNSKDVSPLTRKLLQTADDSSTAMETASTSASRSASTSASKSATANKTNTTKSKNIKNKLTKNQRKMLLEMGKDENDADDELWKARKYSRLALGQNRKLKERNSNDKEGNDDDDSDNDELLDFSDDDYNYTESTTQHKDKDTQEKEHEQEVVANDFPTELLSILDLNSTSPLRKAIQKREDNMVKQILREPSWIKASKVKGMEDLAQLNEEQEEEEKQHQEEKNISTNYPNFGNDKIQTHVQDAGNDYDEWDDEGDGWKGVGDGFMSDLDDDIL